MPHAVFHSLISLCRLAEKGVDPAHPWECRRTLSVHQCRSSLKRRQPALSLAHYQRADARGYWKLLDNRQHEGIASYLPRLLNVLSISVAQRQAVLCAMLKVISCEVLARRAWQLLHLAPKPRRVNPETVKRIQVVR